jgi:nucleotide-binding universal stress UspA family protein
MSTTIDRLVVPLDGCAETLPALRVAESLGRRIDIPVTAVVVTAPEMGRYEDDVWLKEHATSDLVAMHHVVELSDDVVGSILGAAADDGSFLCMASHGRTGAGAALLGSVSADVVATSLKEVLLVGPHCQVPQRFQTVLVCVDGDTPDSVIEAGGRWATWLEATPLVVTVEEAQRYFLASTPGRARMEDAEDRLRRLGLEPRTSVLCDSDRAGGLLHRAALEGAALVVAGTHQRRGIDRILLGSVSRGLVHRGELPVALVPPG